MWAMSANAATAVYGAFIGKYGWTVLGGIVLYKNLIRDPSRDLRPSASSEN